MSSINNWYGENNINWGKSYSESWWGNVNEVNNWGILYPATAEGSIIYADTTLFTADMTGYTADIGNDSVVVSPDTTPPVITITGSSSISLNVGDSYTDAGATATDNIDGNLTSSIITSGTVDTATAGTYTITYSVSDAAGNSTSASRTVIVASNATPGTVTNTTWNYLVHVVERFTDVRFGASLNYGGNTYSGFTYNLSDFTAANGIDPSAVATRSMRIDTNSIDVGTFIADANGVLVDSADNHSVSIFFFPPYAAFSTPVYMKIALNAADFLTNPYNPYPIYKLEQVNGYVQVTQKIIS